MTSAHLAVAPGGGRLARRTDGLLFVPPGAGADRWHTIVQGYLDAATPDDAREVVTAAAMEARFRLDPFVIVTWTSSIDLLVLGAAEVRTDLPSVPVLSGASFTTWVEHRVVRPPASAHVVAGSCADPATRLDAGAVVAGGFALTLTTGRRPLPPPTVAPAGDDGVDLEMTIHPPAAAVAAAGARQPPVPERPGLVRARRCRAGHANPAHAAQCRTCGELLGAASTVEMIAQPVLGQVVLPDGSSFAVNATSVLGRKPDTEAARVESTARLVPLAVDGGVSRTHVVIRADGWTMTATDCGSRGGTVLRSPGAAEPERLEPWVPHELSAGDTLYLGGPTHVQVVSA